MNTESKQRWEQIFTYGKKQSSAKKLREKDVHDEIRRYRRQRTKDK